MTDGKSSSLRWCAEGEPFPSSSRPPLFVPMTIHSREAESDAEQALITDCVIVFAQTFTSPRSPSATLKCFITIGRRRSQHFEIIEKRSALDDSSLKIKKYGKGRRDRQTAGKSSSMWNVVCEIQHFLKRSNWNFWKKSLMNLRVFLKPPASLSCYIHIPLAVRFNQLVFTFEKELEGKLKTNQRQTRRNHTLNWNCSLRWRLIRQAYTIRVSGCLFVQL